MIRVGLNEDEEISIGNNVWIAARTMILKGSVIPDGSIVGAGSIVRKKFQQPHCLISGVPANISKEKVVWEK